MSLVLPDVGILRPGDPLTYSASDLWGRFIEWKTGAPTRSHVEVYVGNGQSFGARIDGVNYYPVRLDEHLMEVRRHESWESFNLTGAKASVEDIVGKRYETEGLFAYLDPWHKVKHLIRVCSPTATHFLRGGGLEWFNPDVPDNAITPDDFVVTGGASTVWARDGRIMGNRRLKRIACG